MQPAGYQYLRLFGAKARLTRDEVSKNLRGTGVVPRELEEHGWVAEQDKYVLRISIRDRFESSRQRPRNEMKTEIDQAHFLIGAALPASGVNLETELRKDTWLVRRSVEAMTGSYRTRNRTPKAPHRPRVGGGHDWQLHGTHGAAIAASRGPTDTGSAETGEEGERGVRL